MTVRPDVDRDSAAWWARLAAHELVFQRCADCGRRRWPDRAICNACGSFAWRHEPASGRGEIASWIVNHHRFLPDVAPPYVVVTVRVDEQPDLLLPGAFAGRPDDPGLAIGARVKVGFRDLPADDTDASTDMASSAATGAEPGVPAAGNGTRVAPAALLVWSPDPS
jgi:uncharacterized OB-fold protein